MNSNAKKSLVLIIFIIIGVIALYTQQMEEMKAIVDLRENSNDQYLYMDDENAFKIISSTENADLEIILENFALNNNIELDIEYAGTIEIMEKLNSGE